MNSNRKGFTLVELLAVIVILAILMVSAGAGVMATMNNSKINTFKNEVLTMINSAKDMYSEVSMNMQNSSDFFKSADGDNDYSAMCVTLSGLVNNGYLDKDINTYGGVILVEVPYDGGETKYTAWVHNSVYGVNGIEKNQINKLKFNKKNNTGADSTNGGEVGIVTNLNGIYKYVNNAMNGLTDNTGADTAKGNRKGNTATSGGFYAMNIVTSSDSNRGTTNRKYNGIKCINNQLQ